MANNELKIKRPKFNFYWIYAIIALVLIFFSYQNNVSTGTIKELNFNELDLIIQKGHVDKIVVVRKEQADVYINKDSLAKDEKYKSFIDEKKKAKNSGPQFFYPIGSLETFNKDIEKSQNKQITNDTVGKTEIEKQNIVRLYKPVVVTYDNSKDWGGEVSGWIFTLVIIVVIWVVFMRMMNKGGGGSQIFNFGKAKAQLFDKNVPISTTFNDVAGLEGAKEEIVEIVDFLKNPQKYTHLGGKIPKGVLLVGPPGTGKTLLAKAVAGEAKVPFFSLSGSDFVEMFVGVGASRVRDLFKNAKEKAPCIIFIDEIDAIGRARGKNQVTGGNDERENTLNALLTEMDGFSTNNGVIILAATNRADILDGALMRAGRFDRQIHVELPNVEERNAIFKVHIRDLKLGPDFTTEFFARQTPGFSGADIANVCNEAALIAARSEKEQIEKVDFLSAIDRIVGGLERKSKIISPTEKKVIAYHESGHASVSWLLEHASPLVKVTIVPRGKSLGAAWYLPEERQITTFDQMFDELTALLAGRASEFVFFGQVSTGALNDLERASKMAYSIVVYYGLNDKIGNVSYYDSSGQSEYSFSKPYSEETAKVIDQEIHLLIEKAYVRAKLIIEEQKVKIEEIANALLANEVIFREDVEKILGKRPFAESEPVVLTTENQSLKDVEIEIIKEEESSEHNNL
ncbi:MAG: ATP-dependent zinc metalloprotease FtsH [Bacteroidota bacterium]